MKLTPAAFRRSHLHLWLGLAALALAILAGGCRERPIPQFDEARAFKDLETQVALGPRVPGSEAHRRCRDWMAEELTRAGGQVAVQTFSDTVYGETYELANVRARFGPKDGAWIVLGAHWDTRATADQDPDPANRSKPIPGANDGASGVAVLLELARVFGRTPPPVGVEVVLFDGEDLGRGGDVEGYCRGSRYYVKQLAHPRPALAVILDMVGDKDLGIYQEQNSLNAARNIVERIWEGAGKVGATGFKPGPRHNVYDDHAPFIEAGIPGVDLIDFDYPAWHTLQDGLDQVAPGSLGQVGRTVLWYVYTSEWQ
jgi:Zn-dependent M28 family amino/carboxypeptidase